MATPEQTPRSSVDRAWDAIDQAMEAAIAGRSFRHPSGTVFMPDDIAGRDVALAPYLEEGKRVVAVHGDGSEELISNGRTDEGLLILLAATLVAGWLLGRRRLG